MLTVTIYQGLPASGKSFHARKLIDDSPGKYKRINKDLLREMLDNSSFSKENEKFVLKVRDQLILMGLESGKHILVDDTNLHEKHLNSIRELVKGKAKVIIEDFTDVPLEVCIERDLKRLNSVGEKVIKKMYNQFLKPNPPKIEYDSSLPDIILCDLDGTLCLMNGRNPYDASTCGEDLLNPVVHSIIKGKNVIFVSGREDKYREQTNLFMLDHSIEHKGLLMRKSGDMRKDSIIKEEIYNEHIKGRYNVSFILDDRQQVVNLWRSLGLICLQVAEGDF